MDLGIFFICPIAVFLLVLMTQCSDDKLEEKAFCAFTSTQTIEIPPSTSVTYKIHDVYEPEDIFVAYHYPTHSIDLISLKKGIFIKKIPLERTGPHSIAQVRSLYVHNLDSIILLTTHQIICLDHDGLSSLTLKINQQNTDITGLDAAKHQIWCNPEHNQPIYYSSTQNRLYVGLNFIPSDSSSEKYKSPLAGRISLDTWQFEYLPIYYPDKFKEYYYGILDNPHFVFFDDFTIVGFGADYDLYWFDHKMTSHKAFGFSSGFVESQANPMNVHDPQSAYQDFPKMIAYSKRNPRLAKLRFNRVNMMIYNLYDAPDDPNRPDYRTIGIFKLSKDGMNVLKLNEFVADYEEYMTKIFFPSNQGLGLINQTSTDDVLQVDYMECE